MSNLGDNSVSNGITVDYLVPQANIDAYNQWRARQHASPPASSGASSSGTSARHTTGHTRAAKQHPTRATKVHTTHPRKKPGLPAGVEEQTF